MTKKLESRLTTSLIKVSVADIRIKSTIYNTVFGSTVYYEVESWVTTQEVERQENDETNVMRILKLLVQPELYVPPPVALNTQDDFPYNYQVERSAGHSAMWQLD